MNVTHFLSAIAIALSSMFSSPAVEASDIKETAVKPQAILWMSDTTGTYIKNPENLLKIFSGQVSVNNSAFSTRLISKKGHKPSILFDFGKEIYGSVKIYTGMAESHKAKHMRVCFGESVTEAMSDTDLENNPANPTNEHSMRDYRVSVPWLGSVETGKTGFRFVRLDFTDAEDELPLVYVEARSFMRDISEIGSFRCSNQRLNEIWKTGVYTVRLNMQDYIWDGIKRDRLVWLGDMHPEVMTITNVFGNQELVKKTLDFARDDTPLPGWINGMSSYSLWWLIIQNDFNTFTGDMTYLKKQLPYVKGVVSQIAACIDDNGEETLDGTRFLDWPSSNDTDAIHSGLQSLTMMALRAAVEIGKKVKDSECLDKASSALKQMKPIHPHDNRSKQAAALAIISGQSDNFDKDAETILTGGALGFSTFYGYYMLEALAKAGKKEEACRLISDYWGAMLDLGATSFWEDLNYDDVAKAGRIDGFVADDKFDIHADGGDYCYKGLRLSLCHGWASGPSSWLMQNVLGIRPVEAGCTEVMIEPFLGSLEWAEGTFPTPRGVLSVKLKKDKTGKIIADVKAPEGIKIICKGCRRL